MSLPTPLPGLVVRYSYLWADDAAAGREEGGKERPAAVVMAVDRYGRRETRVYVLAITHAAPVAGTEALDAVGKSEGVTRDNGN